MHSRSMCRLGLLVGLVVLAVGTSARAEDLEGTLSVVGNHVVVRAHRDDKSAAVGARVRLVKAGLVVAEGKIDDKGTWASDIDKAGAYEIWLGSAANDDDLLKMPIAIAADLNAKPSPSTTGLILPCCQGPFIDPWVASEAEAPRNFPWVAASSGVGLLGAAGVFFVRFRRATVLPSERF